MLAGWHTASSVPISHEIVGAGENAMETSVRVCELRVALTVADLDVAVKLYRDGLGLPVVKEWSSPEGSGVVLAVGDATVELIDQRQAQTIDRIEVGRRVSGPVRLAFATPNVTETAARFIAAGARPLSEPVPTPWGDRNVRLEAADHMQVTLFEPGSA
jgi:catechol 2,3-dioxygenase-like lactoylglutathione lyase family enzyme